MAQSICCWRAVIMVDIGNLNSGPREGIIPFSSALVRPQLELSGTCKGWELSGDQEQRKPFQGDRARPSSQTHPTTADRTKAAWGQLGAAPLPSIRYLPEDRTGCHSQAQCPHSTVWQALPTVSRRMLVLSPSNSSSKIRDTLRPLASVSSFAPVCQYRIGMVRLEKVQQETSRMVRGFNIKGKTEKEGFFFLAWRRQRKKVNLIVPFYQCIYRGLQRRKSQGYKWKNKRKRSQAAVIKVLTGYEESVFYKKHWNICP